MLDYQIELELNDGQKYTGKALTTSTSEQKEYLLFSSDTAPAKELKLEVLELKSMRVLSKNARFKFVQFT
ncbi:MAG: transcriptional antiterminator Rof (Rho-off) [Paraglaciecola sp.]|jgi:transcriptional antiterminator Rof (Rho-off)